MDFSTGFAESLLSLAAQTNNRLPALPHDPKERVGGGRFEALYAQKRAVESQDDRRRRMLQELRTKKRDDILIKRYATQWNFTEDACLGSDVNGSDIADVLEMSEVDSSHKSQSLRGKDRVPRLMLSEWLYETPDDFEEIWRMLPCPTGKRCSLLASTGRSVVFSRTGLHIFTGRSDLPGGNSRQPGKECLTVLDCVFNESLKTFFVLDVLFWNGSCLMDQAVDFRFFWLSSRFTELVDKSIIHGDEKYTMSLLSVYDCSETELNSVFSGAAVPSCPVDGFLFYHSEGVYIPGLTPLVCWLKPYMIPEILKMPISSHYEPKPPDYTSLSELVAKKEAGQKQRLANKKSRRSGSEPPR